MLSDLSPKFLKALRAFIKTASSKTYAGNGEYVDSPERPGFYELVYTEGDYFYRDSFTGNSKSRGMEVVRYKNSPVWASTYGGGMVKGKENLSKETFEFLKKAMSAKEEGFDSFRGPSKFNKNEWSYSYSQEGDATEFSGYEEIYLRGELVFFHRIIGGIIDHT